MRLVSLQYAAEGIVVGKSLVNSHGFLLVREGKSLSSKEIERLTELGVNQLYVVDDESEGIEPNDLVPPEMEMALTKSVREAYTRLQQSLEPGKERVFERDTEEAVTDIVYLINSAPQAVHNALSLRSLDDSLYQHSFSTAILAVIIGRSLDLPHDDLRKLASGMLLHDVGMALLPPEIVHKQTPLTQDERDIIKNHSRLGFQVALVSGLSPLAANMILRHHETWNGAGYPDGLAGTNIHLFARIAAVCEVFDALTNSCVPSAKMHPDEALRIVLSKSGVLFDPKVALHLARHVAPYPPGIVVELATGEIGVVVTAEPPLLTRPVVRVIFEQDLQRAQPFYELNLSENRDYRIRRSYSDFAPALEARRKAIIDQKIA